jgi:hypothetical protein
MYQLQARACQTKPGVYVTLAGFLANSCMQAEISGTYPGSIVHFVDPGHGEIFIDEKQRPGSQICLMHLVPWYAQAMLPGSTHKTVVVYVNGKKSLTVPVADEAGLKRVDAEKEWIVTALAGAPKDGPFLDCATHHQNDLILANAKVFGPDTRAAYDKFRGTNCSSL